MIYAIWLILLCKEPYSVMKASAVSWHPPTFTVLMPRSIHWHIWDYASITYSNFFPFALSGISLSEVKCQPATFGRPPRYSPASKKKMPWYCVSAEFSEDQPDQPGWKWRACGHLLRGWEGEISLLIMAGYWSLGLQQKKKKKNTNQCFSSFIIHPQIHIKLILSVFSFMLMLWNWRCLVVNF